MNVAEHAQEASDDGEETEEGSERCTSACDVAISMLTFFLGGGAIVAAGFLLKWAIEGEVPTI
jgi:hypothetical protein